ncbi:hypothetical protein G6F66_009641 [Rhizopus arrhizus]|nr:hypothetical protein G6F66_009641 [Rhizopus arrhizus]
MTIDRSKNECKALTELIKDACEKYADRTLARYHSNGIYKTMTYAEVDAISDRLASQWSHSLQQGQVVSFFSDHGLDYLLMLIALLKLRVTFFAISPRNSEPAVLALMSQTGSKVLLVSSKYKRMAQAVKKKGLVAHMVGPLHHELLLKQSVSLTLPDLNLSDFDREKTTIILHSSGSTNFPKPVYCTHQYMFKVIRTFQAMKQKHPKMKAVDQDDVLLSCAPIFHSFGITSALGLLVVGGSLVFIERPSPSQEDIKQALTMNPCSLMAVPPLVLQQIAETIRHDRAYNDLLRQLKYVFFGGAPLLFDTGEWLLTQGIPIRMMYGMTEAGTVMTSDLDPSSKNWYTLTPFVTDDEGHEGCGFEDQEEEKQMYVRAETGCLATGVANRPDGGYDTNDLFQAHPAFPGYYHYLGRRDHLLIMVNGEKTNPSPMELTIRACPLVKQAIVLGHGRQCTSALIELNTTVDEAGLRMVHKAVQEANAACPSHSVLVDQMIKILPFGQCLPVNVKGQVARKKVEVEYEEMIEALYRDFLDGPARKVRKVVPGTGTKAFLIRCAADVLQLSLTDLQDTSLSLFDLGLNSLSLIQLRNRIADRFDQVSIDFLYSHSTLDALIQALSTDALDRPLADPSHYDQTQHLVHSYLARAQSDFQGKIQKPDRKKHGWVVLLTGATGSLGSFVLWELLKNEKVKKVYCMVRGHHPDQRLEDAFDARLLNRALLKSERVQVLPMRLNDRYLGLSRARYGQLRKEIDIVQHCAWMLDFHRTIEDYDRTCIAPFYHLLQFAYRDGRPMDVHFVSSVSATALWGDVIEEKPAPVDARVAMPKGYAQSKFVVECVLSYLVEHKGLPWTIERLGQVCGDTEHGVWNTSEQYPLMFVGGAGRMHQMPALDLSVDWIPVDHAARTLVDILLHVASVDTVKSVYHVVQPRTLPWSALLDILRSSGLSFETVSTQAWVRALESQQDNPAYRLLPFYKNALAESFRMPTFQTLHTASVSSHLHKAPVIDHTLFTKFLVYWERVGFYNPSYDVDQLAVRIQ